MIYTINSVIYYRYTVTVHSCCFVTYNNKKKVHKNILKLLRRYFIKYFKQMIKEWFIRIY